MEFGMMHEFQPAPRATEAQTFADSIKEIDAAEKLGLDVMWLADLHFVPQLSVLSSPLVVAGAIAARTSRMKIGTAVQIAPLCHPLRLAEDVATVDHLSRGRFIFGVGRSNFPGAYKAFDVPYAESRARLLEMLELLKQAWTEPTLSFEGTYYRFRKLEVVPKPFQRPYPPMRVAVETPESAVDVAKLGLPIFVSVRIGTFRDLVPLARAYREAYRAAGHAGSGEVYLRVPLYVADTDDRARDEADASVMGFMRHVAELLEWSARGPGGSIDERRMAYAAALRGKSYRDVLRDHVIVGSTHATIDRLRGLRDEVGLDGILAQLNCGGCITHEQVMNALKLLCLNVMPQFK
jgi:alkanesulfonate monooxygenase SsuD/methylene tetrahydromethanopterin reductase-like flavin-dependent oxidoreductase (luciferase family)